MKIKETYGVQELDIEIGSVDIVADDGRTLFTIDVNCDGSIEVHASSTVKHNGVLLDTKIDVSAQGCNWFRLTRQVYK